MANESKVDRTPRRPRMGPGHGPGPGMGAGEKAKDFKSAIKRLFKELKGFRKLIAVALILAILSAVLSISAPNKLSDLTDKISEGLMPPFAMDMEGIKGIAIFLLGLYVCSAIFNFIQAICMTNVANKFAKKLRTKISVKINNLPLKYFDKHQSGDILSRVTIYSYDVLYKLYYGINSNIFKLIRLCRNDVYIKKFSKILFGKTRRIR